MKPRRSIIITLAVVASVAATAIGAHYLGHWWDNRWHVESVTESNSSWRGSYQNATKTLRLRSHAWKLIGYDANKDRCEWGFKVTLEFPDNPDYKPFHNDPTDPKKITAAPVMTVSKIDYDLYDRDGFHLTSLSLSDADMAVEVGQTTTFQHTGVISTTLAQRASSGRVVIQAGYRE